MKKIVLFIFTLITSNCFAQQYEDTIKETIYNNILGMNSEPILFKEVSLSSYQLISANIQFSENNGQQKVIISPFKILIKKYIDYLSETIINISQKESITTFGIGYTYDNSSPYGSKAKRLSKLIISGLSMRTKNENETDVEYEVYKSEYLKELRFGKYVAFYKELSKNVIKINLGYNIQLFKILGGDNVDINNNNLIDNFYSIKSHNCNVGMSYNYNQSLGIGVNFHYAQKRQTPEEGQKIIPYIGGSLSFGVKMLDLDKNYETSEDFLKSLFIPSIGIGCSFEYQKCTGDLKYCEEGKEIQFVATPFIDIKLNPKNQFRLGFPINKTSYVNNKNQTSMGPFIQYCFQISGIQ
jgi:hypothetical protein